mmetsp:Transcript_120802/g.313667  ORF Transcript_120802/g.313667 Transcript_120802/m.313667 type:complete len:1794 (-) Transcript_120802:25-5406(-)
MSGKGKCELQRRLEGGTSRQDVVLVSFRIPNVNCAKLASDANVPSAFEAAVRKAVAAASTKTGCEATNVVVTMKQEASLVDDSSPQAAEPYNGYSAAADAFAQAEAAERQQRGEQGELYGEETGHGAEEGYNEQYGDQQHGDQQYGDQQQGDGQNGHHQNGDGGPASSPGSPLAKLDPKQLGSLMLYCVITPPAEVQAMAVSSALQPVIVGNPAKMNSLLTGFLEKQISMKNVCPREIEITDVSEPEIRPAVYPDLKLSGRHGIPNKVFSFLEGAQAMDDARQIRTSDGGFHPAGCENLHPEEVTWALQKTAELFKDAQLERLFVLVVTSLQRRSSRSCVQWAGSIAPSSLRNILFDNPVKQEICSKPGGATQQQQQLSAYLSSGKSCVAIAAIAGDVLKQWAEDFTAEDKAFLGEAASKLSVWPDMSVQMARGIFDPAACRYIIVDGVVRSQQAPELAMRLLRRVPKDVVCSRLKAPWRECREVTFLHLYEPFRMQCKAPAGEDLVEYLVEAFLHPEADLNTACKAFVQDWAFPSVLKKDFFVSFVSECRLTETEHSSPEPVRRCWIFWVTPPEPEVIRRTPDIDGLEVHLFEIIAETYITRVEKNGAGLGTTHEDLADVLEALLLIAKGDALWTWGSKKMKEDPRSMELVQRFLRMDGARRMTEVLRAASKSEKEVVYDEARAKELVDEGKKLWTHDGRKLGALSQYIKEKTARKVDDYIQMLLMYFRLELALGANTGWTLVQALENPQGSGENFLNRFAPTGSSLRKAIAKDIQRSVPCKDLQVGHLETLMSYSGYWSPAFQVIVRGDDVVTWARGCVGKDGKGGSKGNEGRDVVLAMLEVFAKLLSWSGGAADLDVRETFVFICEQCQVGGYATAVLLGAVLTCVLQRSLKLGNPGVTCAILCDCAKELAKAGQVLGRKLAKGGGMAAALLAGTERAVGSSLAAATPDAWASSLRSLDTVIFTLEFMGKEDFTLAKERFKYEIRTASHRRRLLWELLACVTAVYKGPLAGTNPAGIAADMDLKEYIKTSAPQLTSCAKWCGISFEPSDWKLVLDIAGAAAECMRKKFNVVMIPHHTQIFTLLMFGVRACGVLAKGGGQSLANLPKTMLARVGTGEGKSLIIGMLAAFVAMKGLRAHVINDNRVLTRRDYDTNLALFKMLGINASPDPERLTDKACSIVYCTGDDIEKTCVKCLTEGEAEQYEKDLAKAVLIVDEVDGMIFDKGPASAKEFIDGEFSEWVNGWLDQLENTGTIERDWDDFRAAAETSAQIQREVEAAFHEAMEKKEGKDYAIRGEGVYMLNPKTHMIQENSWSLWLEVLRRNKTGKSASYRYVKAILCRLQCFRTYACIFGLTGSLGQESEKQYLLDYYDAVTFNVPFFLDTCRSDEEAPSPHEGELVIINDEQGDAEGRSSRKGTKGSIGMLVERNPKQKMCRVDFGDEKGLWYQEGCIAKCPSSKRAPADISIAEPVKGWEVQEQSVIELAARKCSEVPVLVLARSSNAVQRLAGRLREHLGECYGGDTRGVIELLQNPRNPQEFVQLVELSTEPLPLGEAQSGWRITVTTAEGGRGHDYRVVDPSIDDNGGLLLILTWMPWSEREWIQFIGRTGRQDHAGQYATILDAEDEKVQAAVSQRKPSEKLPDTILRLGDEDTAGKLKGVGTDIAKAKLMHRLTSHYWTAHKSDKTSKNQDWVWKKLCAEYMGLSLDAITKTFTDALPEITVEPPEPEKTEKVYAPTQSAPLKSMAELTCSKCGHISFAHWTPDKPVPRVDCEKCGTRTLVSAFVPVYSSSI